MKKITGKLVDRIKYEDGSSAVLDRGFNTICTNCHNLIALLIGNEFDDTKYGTDLWFAIGTGDTQVQSEDTELDNEIFRVKIKADDITVDNNTLTVKVSLPKSAVNFESGDVFPPGLSDTEYNVMWKECGIFYGTDTSVGAARNGYMINRKLSTVDKNDTFSVERSFTFTL